MPTTKVPASRMISYDTGSFCFRNKIINGDMRIDQRSNGNAYINPAGANILYGTVDRWGSASFGSNITYQRVSGASFNAPINNPVPYAALRMTGATGNTGAQMWQRIESINCYDLMGQTVTVSFRVVSNTTLTCFSQVYIPDVTDTWGFATAAGGSNFTSTTTPSTVTYSFVMPTTVTRGAGIVIGLASLLAGQTIDITNVQLEVGPTATPFEYRPIGTELALCQRYFCREGVMTGQSALLNRTMCYTGANSIFFSSKYPVTMRTAPLVTVNLDRTDTAPFTLNSTVNAADGVDSYADRFFVHYYANMTTGQYIDLNGYTADAEL